MDYTKLLKRAWEFVWSYRALWIVGALLAITTINGIYIGGSGSQNSSATGQNTIWLTETMHIALPGEGIRVDLTSPGETVIQLDPGMANLQRFINAPVVQRALGNLQAVLYTAIAAFVVSLFVGGMLRYTSEAALIRMVDEAENTGEKLSFRQGMRMGWSRTAWQLFLIDLLILVPLVLGFTLLFMLAVLPLVLWISGSAAAGILGTAFSIGLLILYGVLLFAVTLALSPLLPLFRRACAVDGMGVRESIRQGLRLASKHFTEVLLVWLIWIGTRLAWMVLLIPMTILLLPVIVATLLIGIMIAGIPAATVGWLLSLGMPGAAPWLIGTMLSLPVFILVGFAPLYFLSGLVEVFKSSTWTLAYRQLRTLEKKVEEPAPKAVQSRLQAAQIAG